MFYFIHTGISCCYLESNKMHQKFIQVLLPITSVCLIHSLTFSIKNSNAHVRLITIVYLVFMVTQLPCLNLLCFALLATFISQKRWQQFYYSNQSKVCTFLQQVRKDQFYGYQNKFISPCILVNFLYCKRLISQGLTKISIGAPVASIKALNEYFKKIITMIYT